MLFKRLLRGSAVLLLLAPAAAAAQHTLVLSGGGARGLSHAGAVGALEQLGYRPPLVVGTSMGAIVGALYAAGYAPADVWRIVAAENWLERFAAEPLLLGPARLPQRPLLHFGLGRGRLHEGVVPTTGVNLRLVELLFDAGVRARNDFDHLPLRYRAIAADLATGEQVVLGRGDLPRAVRASMAVPGVFAPVRWDARLLGDGGIANNLPISVADSLSTDPILAIDVLRPALDVEEVGAFDLGVRALRLLIENARPDGVEPDILVLPRIPAGFTEARFPTDAVRLLRAGRDAVLDQVPPVRPPQPDARRPAAAAPARVERLRVESADEATTRLVRRIMTPVLGAYDPDAIIRRTAALYGTGLFHAVWPRLEFDGDIDAATLVVVVTPVATARLAAGAHWDTDTGAGGWSTLLYRTGLITPIELRTSVLLDELSRTATLEASSFSTLLPGVMWTGGVHGRDTRVRVMAGDAQLDRARVRRAGGWAGAELRGPVRNHAISLLLRADAVKVRDGSTGSSHGAYLRAGRLPRPERVVGVEPLLEVEARAGAVPYSRARVRLGAGHTTARVRSAGFLDVHAAGSGTPPDALPAFNTDLAPWLPAGWHGTRAYAAAGIDVAIPFLLDGYLRGRGRAIGTGLDRDGSVQAWLYGGDLGLVWATVAGPLTAGVATGRGVAWRLYAGIGSPF